MTLFIDSRESLTAEQAEQFIDLCIEYRQEPKIDFDVQVGRHKVKASLTDRSDVLIILVRAFLGGDGPQRVDNASEYIQYPPKDQSIKKAKRQALDLGSVHLFRLQQFLISLDKTAQKGIR